MAQYGKCQPNEMVNLNWLGRWGKIYTLGIDIFGWTCTCQTAPTLHNSSAEVINLGLPKTVPYGPKGLRLQ
jgi:hypothetical protein